MLLGGSALDMTDQLDLSSETGVKFWVAKAGVAFRRTLNSTLTTTSQLKHLVQEDPDDT